MILLSLIGEQPIPNLLPILHFAPSSVALAYSDFTEEAAERLKKLLPATCKPVIHKRFSFQTKCGMVAVQI